MNTANRKYDYVIYHKNCLDGFCGFFLLSRLDIMNQDALVYPDMPSAKSVPPNIGSKNVIIVDVAYSEEILAKIFDVAKYVLFIDHHVSIRNNVMNLIKMNQYEHDYVYDEFKSGCSLVWDFFYKGKMPDFVKYIEDNDTGQWKYKNTIPFVTSLRVKYSTAPNKESLEKWEKLYGNSDNNDEVRMLVETGKTYMEYENYLLDKYSKRYTLERFPSMKICDDFKNVFQPGQYIAALVNGGGCPDQNMLSDKIMDENECDFCIMWTFHMDKKEYVLSFRSRKTDVAKIASLFGGGGHKLAAACAISMFKYNIHELFFPKSLPR